MDKATLIRTVLLLIGLINQVLTLSGLSVLPISDDDTTLLISTIYTVVVSLWAWWKNNYVSKTGLAQKEALKAKGLYRP